MNLVELEEYLKQQGAFTVAEIQHKFSCGYAVARETFRDLEQAGKICFDSGVTYKWVPNQQTQATTKTQSVDDSKDDDDEQDRREEFITRRRKELMERLAKISQDIDEDNEDDDDDELDEFDVFDWRVVDDDDEEDNVRLLGNYNYGNMDVIANHVIMKLKVFNVPVKLKAIQIGATRTRYVFDLLSTRGMSDLLRYRDDVKTCIKTDKEVRVIAPFGSVNQFAVDVEHEQALDSDCKKALIYWLEKQNGKASIASLQRGLAIGFNRAGRIMDALQKLNCVECLNPSDSSIKPLLVKVSLKDVEVLFPKSLGWTH